MRGDVTKYVPRVEQVLREYPFRTINSRKLGRLIDTSPRIAGAVMRYLKFEKWNPDSGSDVFIVPKRYSIRHHDIIKSFGRR